MQSRIRGLFRKCEGAGVNYISEVRYHVGLGLDLLASLVIIFFFSLFVTFTVASPRPPEYTPG